MALLKSSKEDQPFIL